MSEWRAHIHNEFEAFSERVVLHRRSGDRVEIVVGVEQDGRAIIASFDPGVAPGDVGLSLPIGALQAIAEAVKPGPSTGELRVLREALDLERARVDRVLANPELRS